MVTGQSKYPNGRNALLAASILYPHFFGLDSRYFSIKQRTDFSSPYSILDVWLDPVFQALPHFRTAMNQRHSRCRPKKIKRRLSSRISSADNDDVLVPVRVGFAK